MVTLQEPVALTVSAGLRVEIAVRVGVRVAGGGEVAGGVGAGDAQEFGHSADVVVHGTATPPKEVQSYEHASVVA